MTFDELLKLRNAEPFRRFYLVLSDGRKLLVTQPDKIGWHPQGHRLTVYTHGDDSDTLEIANIASVEPAVRKKNGRPSNSR